MATTGYGRWDERVGPNVIRGEAKEAGWGIEGVTSFPDDSWGEFPEGVEIGAAEQISEAASDVWEPLVLDLMSALQKDTLAGRYQGGEAFQLVHDLQIKLGIMRTREALEAELAGRKARS
jgi:hypothetical protein